MASDLRIDRRTGLFCRDLGWKRTPTGFTQHRFYLGRDRHHRGPPRTALGQRRGSLATDQE